MFKKLIDTECSLRCDQRDFGQMLFCFSSMVFIAILFLPFIFTIKEENVKWIDILFSDKYLKLMLIASIPYMICLVASIILMKSSVKKIAESASKVK